MKKDFSKVNVSEFEKNLDLYLHFLDYITETCPVEFCGDAPIKHMGVHLKDVKYEMHVFSGIDKLAEMLGIDRLERIDKGVTMLPSKYYGFYYTTRGGTRIEFFQIFVDFVDDFAEKDCLVFSEMAEEEREKIFDKVCYHLDN